MATRKIDLVWKQMECFLNKEVIREDRVLGFKKSKKGYSVAWPKMELTTFHGENPKRWLRRCREFFKISYIPVHQ
jgi:hypothetical protein